MKQATRIAIAIQEFNRASAEAQAIKVNQAPPNVDLLPLPKATVIYEPFKGYWINGVLREQTADQLIEQYERMTAEHLAFITAWKVEHGIIPVSLPPSDDDIPF